MAKSRKARASLFEPVAVAPPSAGATPEKRAEYLIHEMGSEAGFLEQWIAHYLAELLATADDSKVSAQARSNAREEIARVIPALWEQQIAREAVKIRAKVDYSLRETDILSPEHERVLMPLLLDPEKAADITLPDVWSTLRALWNLSELITRFLVTTTEAEKAKQEVTSEAVQSFLKKDEEVQGIQTALARLIPEFAAVDPTDWAAVVTHWHQALLTVTRAQLALLTRIAQEDEEG